MALSSDINGILDKMHSVKQATDKGTFGELNVFTICEDIYNRRGGILIHSYTYSTVKGLAGNIKWDGKPYLENIGSFTEIDILLCTRNKIFPIEVKAYKANKITLTNERITGCRANEKSPVHQNEMHMRHLYPHIYTAIPNGSTGFIEPIVVFVDETEVIDSRTQDNREYIKVTILNQLRQLIEFYDKPFNNTLIDLPLLEKKLRNAMISSEKFLPYIQK